MKNKLVKIEEPNDPGEGIVIAEFTTRTKIKYFVVEFDNGKLLIVDEDSAKANLEFAK